MAESQPLLSEAEIAALSSGVSSGEIPTDTGFNTEANVRKHDLASEDRDRKSTRLNSSHRT